MADLDLRARDEEPMTAAEIAKQCEEEAALLLKIAKILRGKK